MPRSNLAIELERQMTRLVDEQIADYENDIKLLMTDVHEDILQNSPVWTGYYKSNHTIVLRRFNGTLKTQGFNLSPQVKESEEPGFYVGNIDSRAATEREKIDLFEAGDSVEVTNAVEYAGEIETRSDGKGQVYANAAAKFGLKYHGNR